MVALLTKISGLTLARLLGALATFAITIVIARQFGTDNLAIYAVCISLANLAAVAIPLGLQSLATVEVAKLSAFPDRPAIRDFIAHGRHIMARSWLVATLLTVLFVAAVFLTGQASEYTRPAAIAVLAFAPIMALNQFHGGVLIGLQKPFSGQLSDGLVRPLVALALLFAAITMFEEPLLCIDTDWPSSRGRPWRRRSRSSPCGRRWRWRRRPANRAPVPAATGRADRVRGSA